MKTIRLFLGALLFPIITTAWAAPPFPPPGNLAETVAALQAQVAALQAQVLALQAKTGAMNADATNVYFTGVNVHIRSGLDSTSEGCPNPCDPTTFALSGLGNLIVGYDEPLGLSAKTGSHNVIIGRFHNYTNYGGLVAGEQNTISGQEASVSGGIGNTASGDFASVSGGNSNTASGRFASVSGGNNNTASGEVASVSGGGSNTASGFYASVSGGSSNTASSSWSSVSGGNSNTASGDFASVSGGNSNTASGVLSSVSGGELVDVTGGGEWATRGIEANVGSLNLQGTIIRLNGGSRPASGVGDLVNVTPGPIVTGSPTVLLP